MGLFNPILSLHSWPWAHKHLQSRGSVEAGDYAEFANGESYGTFLLNPPAPAYNFRTAIPIDAYEGFRRRIWWQIEFQKFGHQGLKLTNDFPRRCAESSTGLQFLSTLDHGPDDETIADLLRAAYPSEDNAAVSFMETAQRLLAVQGYVILAKYLRGLVLEAVLPEVESRRLAFEAQTWARTYDQELCGLAEQTLQDFRVMDSEVRDLANTPQAVRPHIKVEAVNGRLDGMLQDDLMELHRK